MKKTVENLMPPLSCIGWLVSALQATDDPERYARTLLSALVHSERGGEAMAAFAPFVREEPELRLVGAEAAPRMGHDSPVRSLAGSDAVAAGCCRADVRSSRRHRFGIFEPSGGGRSSPESAGPHRPADGRATARPPLAGGAAIQAGTIGAAEAAGGLASARVAAGMASEAFSEAAGL